MSIERKKGRMAIKVDATNLKTSLLGSGGLRLGFSRRLSTLTTLSSSALSSSLSSSGCGGAKQRISHLLVDESAERGAYVLTTFLVE